MKARFKPILKASVQNSEEKIKHLESKFVSDILESICLSLSLSLSHMHTHTKRKETEKKQILSTAFIFFLVLFFSPLFHSFIEK